MTPDDIPQHLVDILDAHAGKHHSRTGPALTALAAIITADRERTPMPDNRSLRPVPRYTDTQRLVEGLTILRKYHPQEDVSLDYEGHLYAGPQDPADAGITAMDAEELEDLGWTYNHHIGRWSWT